MKRSGKPAARITDRTARGGKISTGDSSVLINNRPAARVTDHCVPPPGRDAGPIVPPCSSTVLIGNRPAARVGDRHSHHGGEDPIVSGDPTVLIGGMDGLAVSLAAGAAPIFGLSGRKSGGAQFTPADADRTIWNRWGRLLPADMPRDLAQRSIRCVPEEQMAEEVMAEVQRAYAEQGITLSPEQQRQLEREVRRVEAIALFSGEVLVPKDADGDVVLHESLHRYAHPDWIAGIQRDQLHGDRLGSFALDEGMTDMLTRQALGARGAPAYDEIVREVETLCSIVGQDTVERAYFSGDVVGLKREVDRAMGPGVWDYMLRSGRVPPVTVAAP